MMVNSQHKSCLVANAIGARSDGRSPVEVRAVPALNLNVDPRTPGRPPSPDYMRHGHVSVHVSPCPSEQGRTASARAGEVAYAALGAVCVCCGVLVGVAISAVVVGGVMLIYGD
jgi:hypothetical protein